MHLETLLYMLLQSNTTVPPPGVRPDFEALASKARSLSVPNKWIKVPATSITIGLDDPENDNTPDRYFGWDNEKPSRVVQVPTFESKARGITNAEYACYLAETNTANIPASWILSTSLKVLDSHGVGSTNSVYRNNSYTDGASKLLTNAYLSDKAVRTVYGPVPLIYALDWPAIGSYDELAGCAKWMNGRIPTMEEARSIYNYVDQLELKEAGEVLASTIPAVNGYAIRSRTVSFHN